MNFQHNRPRGSALRSRIVRVGVMLGLVFAAPTGPVGVSLSGGDGFRMASVGPRSSNCLVGDSGEGRGRTAYVRTAAAGISPTSEPAALVLFAIVAGLMELRRRSTRHAVRLIPRYFGGVRKKFEGEGNCCRVHPERK